MKLLFPKVTAVIGVCLSMAWATSGQDGGPATPKPKEKKPRFNQATGRPITRVLVEDEVREANWCVTGRDEPEMQHYPYNDFQPYLARTDTINKRIRDTFGKVKYDYKLRLDEIKFSERDEDIVKATRGIGRGFPDYTPIGKMHNTAHLKFNVYKLRPYPLGVKLVRIPSPIEGLVIQMNHSPLGMGTATGQFKDPELDVICSDCRHPQGRPVGCRKRTKNDIVPPAIMMYHHQMSIFASYRKRTNPKPTSPPPCLTCRELEDKNFCRCNIRSYPGEGAAALSGDKDCSQKPETQAVIDDCATPCYCYNCFCHESKAAKPAVPAVPASPVGVTPVVAAVAAIPAIPAVRCRCNEYQYSSSPIAFLTCPATSAPGIPTETCNPTRGDPSCACTGPQENEAARACRVYTNRFASGFSVRPMSCICNSENIAHPEATENCATVVPSLPSLTTFCKIDEDTSTPETEPRETIDNRCRRKDPVVYPDCFTDNTVEGCSQHGEYLQYLNSTRSDFLGKTDEVHANLQWYFPPCLRSRAVEFLVLIVHSFAKQEYEVITLGPFELPTLAAYPDQSQYSASAYFHGFSKLYICDDPEQSTTILTDADRSFAATYPFQFSYSYDQCIRNISQRAEDGGQFCPLPEVYRCSEDDEEKYSSRFDRSCDQECEMTTVATNTTQPKKKTPHGAINIITNFCVQPIAIFIGRYYKETLNRKSFKGWELWFWVHLLGSGFASIAMYVGYFHPVWLPRTNQHIIAGNTIMILLALTYVSSWIRNTNKWMRIFAEFLHGGCGYCCSFLAYWCLHTVELPLLALIFIYSATGCLGAGYLIMEACIFFWDRKFGMQPHRRHFPTVEARLGDLPLPGAAGRIAVLAILSVAMLALTSIAAVLSY